MWENFGKQFKRSLLGKLILAAFIFKNNSSKNTNEDLKSMTKEHRVSMVDTQPMAVD